MNKFLHNNFESFQSIFEKTFNQKICHWIRDNIDIKESKKTRSLELPKNFACFSLLADPNERTLNQKQPFNFLEVCDNLFSSIKNLNGRSPHEYLANHIHGTLQEALHKYRLQKKHSNYDFRFLCSEFNYETNKREIYTKPQRRQITRDGDLEFTCPQGVFKIHIKANNTFKHKAQLTLRGGSLSEFDKIQNSKDYLHILISPDEYISINNFDNISEHIETKTNLNSNQNERWGGDGATRFIFKPSIFNIVKTY